ncbi:hypothetical protein NIES4074_00790 [Cylindrospermum sp. NIES-4074]|nr:hypothetical protein NIES4074_00790 [Cylindrospermum sp. NIES-4074]
MVYKRVQKNNSSSSQPYKKGTNKKSDWKNNWGSPFTESSFGIQPQADTDSTPHQGTNEYRSTKVHSRILANIQRQALAESQPSPLQPSEKAEEVSNEAVEIQRQSESSESGEEDSNSANGGTIQRSCSEYQSELPVEPSELESEISPQSATIQRQNTPEAQYLDQTTPIQAKLTIGAPGDKYEQEADSMAERVMSMDAPTVQQQPIGRKGEEPEESIQRQPIATSITPLIQRFSEVIQRLTEEKLQAKAAIQTKGKDGASPATPDLESRLASQQGGGTPLDKETRSFMEPRFGADFSSVKVHTDSSSVQMNKELGAQAFTHGHDVYFGAGKYNPGADDGKRLLAHELTHVVQQTGAVQPKSTPNLAFKKNKIQTKALLTPLSEAQSIIQHKKQNSPAQTKQNKQQQPKPSVPGADVETGKAQSKAPTGKNPADAPQVETKGGTGSVNTPATVPASGADTGKASATVKAGGAAVTPQVKTKGGAKAPATVPAGGAAAATSGEKAPASAESDPAYQAVISSAKGIGEQHKEHPPSESKAQEAQAAAESPSSEVDSKAQANQVGEMGQTETSEFDAAGFKAKLMARIADMAPKNLEEADNFKNNNQLDSVKGDLSGQVKDEQKASKDPLEAKAKETPDTSGIEAKQVTPLPPNDPGAETSDIGADKAAPKPKSQEEVEAPLQAESQKLDEQMAEANVTEEQLSNSNEPAFQGALTAKKEAQTKAAQAPQGYRQQEEGLISNAKNTAVSTAQQLLQAMHGTRTQSLGQVTTQQTEAKSKDEQARAKIAGDINKIYENTKTKVEQSLADLDSLVLQAFDTGAGEAKKAFEDYVKQKMDAYKDERYGGPLGPAKWVKDKFVGLPSEVNVFYEQGRQLYIAKMDGVINNVVAIVSKGITKAKTEITSGKQKIQTYIQQLPEDLKAVGQEAATEIQTKFDDLQQQVNDKQDELVNTLAEKYQENLQAVDDSIEKMKSENKGLLQKAADAFMGVIKTILEMKDLLLSALAGAAAAVMDILKNPIQFLTNFIQAVKQGFLNFVKNIAQYLQQGLMGWLVGTIGGAGLQMPESFDVKGIFSLVTQVLGFTYDFIRGRAANKLGEEKVAYLEQGEETFKVLSTQGLAGIWHLIQDKIGDIKTMVMDGIQSFVMTSIVQAGVEWVLSLLTPASAFVKACKMIIDIVRFFIERGSQIAALMGAITSSISAIASGAVGEAIQAIESALARSIPVALGFLASLLGLGGISQKIQGIIQKVRQPVAKAVDWVIDKGAKVANKVGGKINKTKFGSKVAGVKNAAQEKYQAGKKFVEDKKAAGEKWFDDKKQAVHQATEKQKNRFLNSKAGKALTRVNDAANKKLDALEKKRQAFKNKIDAAKEWPGKQLEKVQDKAAELGGRAKDKFKQSKLGKGFANQLDKAKDWGGKKKTAIEDKFGKASNKLKDKFGFGKDKEKGKEGEEGKITAADREKHESYAQEIEQKLKKKTNKKFRDFDSFHTAKKNESEKLRQQYQTKLKDGIKLSIEFQSPKEDKKDGDIDIKITIAPNTTVKNIQVGGDGNQSLQDRVALMEQKYESDFKGIKKENEEFEKYKHLETEIKKLKERVQIEDSEEIQEDIKKAEQKLVALKKILEIRTELDKISQKIGGKGVRPDAVIIYGDYNLTVKKLDGTRTENLRNTYTAISGQGDEVKQLEEHFKTIKEKLLGEFEVLGIRDREVRQLEVNLGQKKDRERPDPSHDAETKLLEQIVEEIGKIVVHGNEINQEKLKAAQQEEKNIRDKFEQTQKLGKEIKENQKSLQEALGDGYSSFEVLEEVYKALIATLKSERRSPKEEEGHVIKQFKTADSAKKRLEVASTKLVEMGGIMTVEEREDKIHKAFRDINLKERTKLDTASQDWEITGTININDEQAACTSCQGIIAELKKRFKNVKVNLVEVVKSYHGR